MWEVWSHSPWLNIADRNRWLLNEFSISQSFIQRQTAASVSSSLLFFLLFLLLLYLLPLFLRYFPHSPLSICGDVTVCALCLTGQTRPSCVCATPPLLSRTHTHTYHLTHAEAVGDVTSSRCSVGMKTIARGCGGRWHPPSGERQRQSTVLFITPHGANRGLFPFGMTFGPVFTTKKKNHMYWRDQPSINKAAKLSLQYYNMMIILNLQLNSD